MLFIPQVGDLLAGLADVGAVGDLARKGVLCIERREDALVHAHAYADIAIQVDGGSEDRGAGVDGASLFQQADQCFHFAFLDVLDHAARERGALGDQFQETLGIRRGSQFDFGTVG